MRAHEAERVPRIQRTEDRRVAGDLGGAEAADHREPHEHDRAEDVADPLRPVLLEEEEQAEDQERERDHGPRERRGGDFQALGRAQDRDRRRDDAVPVQQGGAEETERDDGAPPDGGPTAPRLLDQREQREDPALAPVIQAHDEDNVLHADDQDERPDDEREHPIHRRDRGPEPVVGGEALLERVEGARADVAVDDAESRERKDGEPPPGRAGLGRWPAATDARR